MTKQCLLRRQGRIQQAGEHANLPPATNSEFVFLICHLSGAQEFLITMWPPTVLNLPQNLRSTSLAVPSQEQTQSPQSDQSENSQSLTNSRPEQTRCSQWCGTPCYTLSPAKLDDTSHSTTIGLRATSENTASCSEKAVSDSKPLPVFVTRFRRARFRE